VLLPEDHLDHAGGVPEIDEDDPAVVAPAGHPPGERHRRAGVARAQTAGVMGTDHGNSSPHSCQGGAAAILSGAQPATFQEVARIAAVPVWPTSVTSTRAIEAGMAAVSTHS